MLVATTAAALLLGIAPVDAQSVAPAPADSPSPAPAPVAAPVSYPGQSVLAAPASPAAPKQLNLSGFFRAYDFTRQNASNLPGGAGQVNQQSIELGLGLHADYTFGTSPFSVGATYLYAAPTDGCGEPASHLSPPCGKLKAPALNPDDTLPGFILNTLYEAYAQFKTPHFLVKAGDQVFNTPWTTPSDTRIKPTAFEGIDANYFSGPWSAGVSEMDRFEGRVNSTFQNNTLLTSFPAGTTGAPANIYVPGGNDIPTPGLQNVRVGFAGTAFTSNLYFYQFDDIADLAWLDAKYTFKQTTKPYIALQAGYERQAGSAVLGKIFSTPVGVQVGAAMTRNISVSMSYENIPRRSDTVRLPAGDACNANELLTVKKGTTFPFLLPLNAPECITNPNGTTTIMYGGMASPYTDGYGTDPLYLASLTQSPADRRAPVSGPKAQATWTSNDKRLIVYVTQSYLEYGNFVRSQQLSEVDLDATWYVNKLRPGPYKGLELRYRYGSREVTAVTTFGSLPLFRYNRAQVEYDF